MVFFLAFLVIQLLMTLYRSSEKNNLLESREREIARDEQEIARLTTRAKWGDTRAARIYLKKLNTNVRLPGERVYIITPKNDPIYNVNDAINTANTEEIEQRELSVPEKWNKLLWERN
jgi:hypothetical protein